MASSTRLIRHRVKSIGNTKKITKAMELVSASKMRKAVSAVLATRPYADSVWNIIGAISKTLDTSGHPLLRKSEKVNRILAIVIASDRGLAGSYNAQMFRKVGEFLNSYSSFPLLDKGGLGKVGVDYITVGKKIQNFVKRISQNIIAAFTNLANNPTSLDVRPIASLAVSEFVSGKYDRVYLIYTDFHSALKQVARVKQLLPIEQDEELGETEKDVKSLNAKRYTLNATYHEYLFEPNQKQVLDMILPRIVEVQVYQAILEANASEHSARMMAMRSATESATDMIDDLVFTLNQVRQGGITRELAEIAAARAAIE